MIRLRFDYVLMIFGDVGCEGLFKSWCSCLEIGLLALLFTVAGYRWFVGFIAILFVIT